MAKLIPVKYEHLEYPKEYKINPIIGEIPVNFKKSKDGIKEDIREMKRNKIKYFSLHTQEPYSNLKGETLPIVSSLENIRKDPSNLWSSNEWVDDFIKFFKEVSECFEVEDRSNVKVIEIHAPRLSGTTWSRGKEEEIARKLMKQTQDFVECLISFYEEVSKIFPGAEIVVENSNADRYLLSQPYQIEQLFETFDNYNRDSFKIGLALDIPQLLQANYLRSPSANVEELKQLLEELKPFKEQIRVIHLWGAKGGDDDKSGSAHHGGLITLFNHRPEPNLSDDKRKNAEGLKEALLNGITMILSDEIPRYFVPELNGDPDNSLQGIIRDLEEIKVKFVLP